MPFQKPIKSQLLKKVPDTSPAGSLITWYQKHKRSLPWRNTQDPYLIWVSEVLLQQTTVKTVIPYYKKFISKFSSIKVLAQAPLEEVFPYWSGLGYYNRVKNLHKSAQIIYQNKYFPRTYKELLKLPGFGPYTARAVSSLAFGEKVAVLDSNVIRVMARYKGFKTAWWNQAGRDFLQKSADKWTLKHSPSLVNQALMELGALVCTPQKPSCMLCPLNHKCQAYQHKQTTLIPLRKKKNPQEIWYWRPEVYVQRERVGLTQNHSLPVLKNNPLFPGPAVQKKTAPLRYHFKHSITHHVIYVLPSVHSVKKLKNTTDSSLFWVQIKDIKKKSPSSLMQKVLKQAGIFEVST